MRRGQRRAGETRVQAAAVAQRRRSDARWCQEVVAGGQLRTESKNKKQVNKTGIPRWFSGKESTCNAGDTEMWVESPGWEDPLEEEMEIYFSILSWEIPWTEKPGRLQSMGLQRGGHD